MKFQWLEGGGLYIKLGRLSMMLGRCPSVMALPAGFQIVWKAKWQPLKVPIKRLDIPLSGFIIKGYWEDGYLGR